MKRIVVLISLSLTGTSAFATMHADPLQTWANHYRSLRANKGQDAKWGLEEKQAFLERMNKLHVDARETYLRTRINGLNPLAQAMEEKIDMLIAERDSARSSDWWDTYKLLEHWLTNYKDELLSDKDFEELRYGDLKTLNDDARKRLETVEAKMTLLRDGNHPIGNKPQPDGEN